ncbi:MULTISPECIES: cytochrome P450 [unclassified Janthinobacterium]|uniref:cytochrome P450 n=1 Tax=unclassified Janthinobacterium TaxID=2610881 RepID=UPI00160B8D73|nr:MULTISPECIES: cytochrome P450 [unclassified Janthinobacterium]MBB5370553.1 unspecific monooxygenase [Janthinobacterium sp. K2C7]MBB5383233.1 unspecific monooxygenase [Janthinobacterium sp. K2Li3]MBB5388687.1 unspecific monooxygenase [Janthinobacterium sp. K2E3]
MYLDDPVHALAAVTHAAPYDYYRRLAAGPPLRFDTQLDCYIAAGTAGVQAVLSHSDCRVRPPGMAVPENLAGTSCGTIFAELVRMNEGARHTVPKQVLASALGQVDLVRLHQSTLQIARDHIPGNAVDLHNAMFELPLFAMAGLLGFAPAQWPQLAAWTRDFVACLSPLSNSDQLAGAQAAAAALLQRFTLLLRDTVPGSLLAEIKMAGWQSEPRLLANLIGLLSQTCEATAGLVGNAVLALRTQAGLHARLRSDPGVWPAMLREVSRHDPSIHNTRRYTACPVEIGGVALPPGQMLLVVLASAGHDASVHAEPGRFMLQRPVSPILTYGHGRHACPGQQLAQTMAAACLQSWADVLAAMPLAWCYQPSLNARIPVFMEGQAA